MIGTTTKRVTVVLLLVTGLLAMPALGAGVALAEEDDEEAEDKAPVYGEEEREPDTDGWLDGIEDVSLESVIVLLSRAGTFVIGGGGSALGQSAPAMLTGLLVLGTALGMVTGTGVGSVGGSVLAVSGVFATVSAGLAPEWGTAIVVFGVGLVASAVFRRLL